MVAPARRMPSVASKAIVLRSKTPVFSDLFCVTDNVEVLRSGLDHDDVGTFIDIALNGTASEAAAARR